MDVDIQVDVDIQAARISTWSLDKTVHFSAKTKLRLYVTQKLQAINSLSKSRCFGTSSRKRSPMVQFS